ncbi:MAG: hypothetical protein WA987_06595 [Cellvibrio sp.]|jgi:hypothetical protein
MQVRATILRIVFILLSLAGLAYVANLKAQPLSVSAGIVGPVFKYSSDYAFG